MLLLGLYSSSCFLHSVVTCFNEVSLYLHIMYLQPVELPYHFFFFFFYNLFVWWWIGAWCHGLVGYQLLVCLFLFLYLGRCVVLSIDVQWRFISRQNICKQYMLNVINKYYSIQKWIPSLSVEFFCVIYKCFSSSLMRQEVVWQGKLKMSGVKNRNLFAACQSLRSTA